MFTVELNTTAAPPQRCFKNAPLLPATEAVKRVMQDAPGNSAEAFVEDLENVTKEILERPATKELVSKRNLSHDETMIVVACALQKTEANPSTFLDWMNKWLENTRRDEYIEQSVGPAYLLLYRAMEKLPLVKKRGVRLAAVATGWRERMTLGCPREHLTQGTHLYHWGVTPFRSCNQAVTDAFECKPPLDAPQGVHVMAYLCNQLMAVDLDPFSMDDAPERGLLLPPPPTFFKVQHFTKPSVLGTIIVVDHLEDNASAYVHPTLSDVSHCPLPANTSAEPLPMTTTEWNALANKARKQKGDHPSGSIVVNDSAVGHVWEAARRTKFSGTRTLTGNQCWERSLNMDPKQPHAWFSVATEMADGTETITVKDRTYNQVQCLVQCLTHKPKDGNGWNNLGTAMSPSDTVVVNGMKYTYRQCYIQALKFEPQMAHAWSGLGATLKDNETATVDKKTFTNQQCYMEALLNDPELSYAWNGLANTIQPRSGGTVTVHGKKYSCGDCYLRSLTLNPGQPATTWNAYGTLMNVGDVVTIGIRTYKKAEIFAEAGYRGGLYEAWYNAGATLGDDETVLVGGRTWTKKECFAESLKKNKNFAPTWMRSAEGISSKQQSVTVHGQTFTAKGCFIKAVEVDPEHCRAWESLAGVLGDDETVMVKGVPTTKADCLSKVESLKEEA